MDDKVIISLFTQPGKKRHTCPTCEAYKREIKKGNKEALEMYLKHIVNVAKSDGGNSFVIKKNDVIKKGRMNIEQIILKLPSHNEAEKGSKKD